MSFVLWLTARESQAFGRSRVWRNLDVCRLPSLCVQHFHSPVDDGLHGSKHTLSIALLFPQAATSAACLLSSLCMRIAVSSRGMKTWSSQSVGFQTLLEKWPGGCIHPLKCLLSWVVSAFHPIHRSRTDVSSPVQVFNFYQKHISVCCTRSLNNTRRFLPWPHVRSRWFQPHARVAWGSNGKSCGTEGEAHSGEV